MKNLMTVLLLTAAFGCRKDQVAARKDCAEKTYDGRICTQQYDPVCGCNGKTYSNSCEAEAYGITKYTKGACNAGK